MLYTINDKKNSGLKSNQPYDAISTYLLEEKKSKFYGYMFAIQTEEDAKDKIEEIRSDHKDARHVVYIYSYEIEKQLHYRFSDDGEPKGTGTKAIYEWLDKEKLTNICIVIVRYFGGILLGAGPLSRAYLNTARGAIEQCDKVRLYHFISYEIMFSYAEYQAREKRIEQAKEEGLIQITTCEFTTQVRLCLNIREDGYEEIITFLQ